MSEERSIEGLSDTYKPNDFPSDAPVVFVDSAGSAGNGVDYSPRVKERAIAGLAEGYRERDWYKNTFGGTFDEYYEYSRLSECDKEVIRELAEAGFGEAEIVWLHESTRDNSGQ